MSQSTNNNKPIFISNEPIFVSLEEIKQNKLFELIYVSNEPIYFEPNYDDPLYVSLEQIKQIKQNKLNRDKWINAYKAYATFYRLSIGKDDDIFKVCNEHHVLTYIQQTKINCPFNCICDDKFDEDIKFYGHVILPGYLQCTYGTNINIESKDIGKYFGAIVQNPSQFVIITKC
jgi:hypothetical protein